MITKLTDAFLDININLSESKAQKLLHFYKLVKEQNKTMNLTSIIKEEDFIVKHYIDSLSIVKIDKISEVLQNPNTKVLDLGTGGGFPGVPLAVVFNNPEYTLLDSLQKRVNFIKNAALKINQNNIYPVHGRAEELAKKEEYRQQFDLCVSRAVANLTTLTEYALPFVKIHGSFIAYKSADISEELEEASYAIEELGGKLSTIQEIKLTLNNEELHRNLILIEKVADTPEKYPRRNGLPSKRPLL